MRISVSYRLIIKCVYKDRAKRSRAVIFCIIFRYFMFPRGKTHAGKQGVIGEKFLNLKRCLGKWPDGTTNEECIKLNTRNNMQDKRFGYFDDDNREYVITDPKTPLAMGLTTWAMKISFTHLQYCRRLFLLQGRPFAASPATATTTCRWTTGGRYFTSMKAATVSPPGSL